MTLPTFKTVNQLIKKLSESSNMDVKFVGIEPTHLKTLSQRFGTRNCLLFRLKDLAPWTAYYSEEMVQADVQEFDSLLHSETSYQKFLELLKCIVNLYA